MMLLHVWDKCSGLDLVNAGLMSVVEPGDVCLYA